MNDSDTSLFTRVRRVYRSFAIAMGLQEPTDMTEVLAPPPKQSGYPGNSVGHLDARVRRMTIRQAADENCSDVQVQLRNCQLAGGVWKSFFAQCKDVETKLSQCVARQTAELQDMGFDDKRRSVAELNWIWREADRRASQQVVES